YSGSLLPPTPTSPRRRRRIRSSFSETKASKFSHGNPPHLSFSSKHPSLSPIPRSLPSNSSDSSPSADASSSSNFCIIEGPETVQDFMQMRGQEIQDNIRSRRNKIFLLMEEVRRLRIQERIKCSTVTQDGEEDAADDMPDMPSTIPFVPHMTPKTLKQLYLTSLSFISGIIVFGGLIAPTLELKLGLGGTSYEDFIRSLHLPLQLSQVDPIVASFSGGAVGVISALMLIEANNVEQQEKKSIDPISLSSASDSPLRVPKTQ
ncbi:hypothetical protein Tsubulata_001334, partial [Turnera subulata]